MFLSYVASFPMQLNIINTKMIYLPPPTAMLTWLSALVRLFVCPQHYGMEIRDFRKVCQP